MKLKYLFIVLFTVLLTSCGPTKSSKISQYPEMYIEKPKTILFIPAINNTTAANAKDLFSTTITPVLSEKGYYVLPIEPILTF